MATRYRRRLYGRRYYGGYNNYRKNYYSRSARKAIGNYKAAVQQKDATQVNLNIMHKCTTSYNLDGTIVTGKTFTTGVYALNIWDLLRRSEFYQSYASMYDQVKIDRIKLKLTPVNWTFNSENSTYKALTIVTAWDRSGLSPEQVYVRGKPATGALTPRVGGDNTEHYPITEQTAPLLDHNGLYVIMGNEICTYSSAQTRNLNPGSSLQITRVLYPSSMAEKSQYVNTSDLKEWYEHFDPVLSRFWGIDIPDTVVGNPQEIDNLIDVDQDVVIGALSNSYSATNNPCYLLEDPSIQFKPTFLLGIQSSNPLNDANVDKNAVLDGPVTFNIEADIGVTFRGLRKAKIVQ